MIRKKNLSLCILTILFLFITGCARQEHTFPSTPAFNQQKVKQLSSIYRVIIEGNFNVDFYTQGTKSQLVLSGDSLDLKQVRTEIKKDTLRIFVDKKAYPRYGPVILKVYLPYFSGISYRGKGQITGKNLRSRQLSLSIYNRGETNLSGDLRVKELSVGGMGNIQLQGVKSRSLALLMEEKAKLRLSGSTIDIAKLMLGGEAWVSMHWVKSNYLFLRLKDKAYVQLAGIANKLDAELWGKSRFNGRYLRVNRGFVKTHNQSTAEVSMILRQHALAMDGSDIYFYNIPEMKTDFMACDGAVLDMRQWDEYTTSEYNRYNK